MKTLIVCTSVSHGNTKKVADTMATTLNAEVVAPDAVTATDLLGYDLIGFGSGIFTRKFHPALVHLIEGLPQFPGTKAFVFATSGFPDKGRTRFSRPLVTLLEQKGFNVQDTFSCRALDTFLPFKPFGGIRKSHPTPADLHAAQSFANHLRTRLTTDPSGSSARS